MFYSGVRVGGRYSEGSYAFYRCYAPHIHSGAKVAVCENTGWTTIGGNPTCTPSTGKQKNKLFKLFSQVVCWLKWTRALNKNCSVFAKYG